MACPTSYTVVILPLKSSFHALHLFLWVKHMRELEREKDGLWAGLQVLEQAQCWYHTRLQTSARNPALVETRTRRSRLADQDVKGLTSCLQRSCMQRVNGSLGSLMSEPNVSTAPPAPPLTSTDSALRWSLTVLGQEVCEKNQQISSLELERDTLLQQLRSLTN